MQSKWLYIKLENNCLFFILKIVPEPPHFIFGGYVRYLWKLQSFSCHGWLISPANYGVLVLSRWGFVGEFLKSEWCYFKYCRSCIWYWQMEFDFTVDFPLWVRILLWGVLLVTQMVHMSPAVASAQDFQYCLVICVTCILSQIMLMQKHESSTLYLCLSDVHIYSKQFSGGVEGGWESR